ncbi:Internalin-J precursor [Peptoniphilus harei]|uniref:Internalin-J n=2 Tax=Peptoniphilus harei TaxID=54005 RepID=A0A2X1ZWQ0_9FIRM|nr:Internalin-J precursor [Peptoniphilus harei]
MDEKSDPANGEVKKDDQHVIYVYKPVEQKQYKVDYEFQPSKAEGTPSELPQGVKDQLPKTVENLADGKSVPSPKEFTPVKDEVNKGTWTFEAWDKETAKINGADEHVTGTWVFTKDEEPQPKEYKVTHEFKSGTAGKDLPDEVKALLPKDQTGKVDGNTVVPTEPEQKEVTTSEGTWTFKGYDRSNATIDGADEHFVGKWEFTPKEDPKPETGSVYVKYVTEDGKELEPESGVLVNAEVGTKYTTEEKTFDGYEFVRMDEKSDPANGEVKKDDQHVIYVYKPVEQKQYKVDYEFQPSKAEGTPSELPQGVKDQLPKTVENLADGKSVPSPKEFTPVKDEVNKGTWTFEAWDKETAKINGADEHVTGTWVFTKDEEPQPKEYKVTHEFKSGTAGKDLPDEVKALLPKDQTGKVDGNTVVPTEPEQKEVTTSEGTWTFKGYDRSNATIDGADEHFVGKWEFTPKEDPKPETGSVYVKYVTEDGKELEPESGVLVNAEVGTKYTTEEKTFDGYEFVRMDEKSDPANGEVKKDDQHVIYVYKPVEQKQYKVDYEFQPSKAEGTPSELPQGVKDQLPKTVENLADGKSVPSPKEFTPVKDEVNKGTWTFEAWDKETAKINGADEHVTGTWVFTKDEEPQPKEYKVTHEFKSGTAGKDLPEEVKALLPKDQTGKVDGNTVVPTEPEQKEVTTSEGTWTFKGYDRSNATIDGADEHFVGKWEFTPKEDPKPETGSVYVKYVTEDGKELEPESGVLVNAEVGTKYTTEEKTFDGYEFVRMDEKSDPANGEVKKDDQHVIYVYKPVEQKQYKVDYEFQPSKAEGTPSELPQGVKDQLPKTVENLADGKSVPSPKEFTPVKDEVNKGTWTFEAWDKETAKINGADEHVTGTWVFTKDEEPQPKEYKVTHEFKSGTAGKDLPDEVKALLPKDQTGKVDGNTVVPTEPEQKEVTTSEGTWTFKGYDRSNATIDGADEHFVGKWEFTPKEDPKPETGSVYVKYVTEDGKELEPESGVLVNAEVGTKYTTEEKTFDGYEFVRMDEKSDPANGEVKKGDQHVTYVYKKKEVTPPTDVVTEYVDENGKTIAPQENGTKDKKDIDGYEFVRTEKDEQGNTSHIYKKKTTPPTTEVVTKYVDENGNPLALEEKGKQNKKDIPAYEYVKTYKDKDGNTVHVYRLKQNPTPSIETRYVDENGNQLLPPKEGTKDPVTIEGYNFIITSKDKNGNTIHTYSKKPTEGVETRFVDTHGNQILADKTGTHDSSLINGYEFVRTEKDEQGNTTHIYRKLPTPSKEVVTKFIDENGLELSNPLTGRNPSKAIPGYEIVRTETDSNGNIIYVYRKKASESEKITKFVDENGKEISKSTKGDNPKKDIDGYEFVRTEKDEQGNTKHIYKKKVTPPAEEKGNVYVKYVTEDGKELEAESEVLVNAEVGTKYTTDKKTFDGYEFVEMAKDSAPANGKVVKGDQHVTYVYKKTKVNPDPKPNTGNVYVQYVTEDGRILSERVVKRNAPVGENYYTDLKSFDGFRFIGMGRNSADTDGKVVEGNLYVTYVYEEIDKHDSTFPSGQNRHHDKGTPVVTIVENSDRVISTIETTEVKERQEELNNNKELNATDKTTDKVEKSEGLNAEDKKESTNNENDYVENYEEEFVEKNKSVNDGNKAPKTQDPGIALYTGLAVASSALLGLFEVKRRKNK